MLLNKQLPPDVAKFSTISVQMVVTYSNNANSLQISSNGQAIFHCVDGSVRKKVDNLLCLNRFLVSLYDDEETLHFGLPFCTTIIVREIFELFDKGVKEVDRETEDKIIEIIKLLGGQVKKDKSSFQIVGSYNTLSSMIVAKGKDCQICSVKHLSRDEHINVEECRCRVVNLLTSNVKVEIWERATNSLKFFDPLVTNSKKPCLNGEITDEERNNYLDISRITLPNKAWPSDEIRVAFIKAIKEKKFPYLSLHNISVIFDRFPCVGITKNDPHVCIFCSKICSNRRQITFHIQRFHSGFSIKCDICNIVKADEY